MMHCAFTLSNKLANLHVRQTGGPSSAYRMQKADAKETRPAGKEEDEDVEHDDRFLLLD